MHTQLDGLKRSVLRVAAELDLARQDPSTEAQERAQGQAAGGISPSNTVNNSLI